ncbi:ATP:cob(I)alamin adenosyltransferase [Falsirhodobacter algicola]|uniref:ATP:cob(I)alamin adenosyltransferase n=1 Tax=Falsirhodobacter algicola TaxID=2692330 RepID=UPI0020131747|nr:ATP:cob(I)alamin adenosyltransferase [Falsirhodobacter algicola]
MSDDHVARLERMVDEWNAALPPLKEFILPGGSPGIAALHVARTVCRRAERRLLTAGGIGPGMVYLNRLSDLLFVAARTAARLQGIPERIWDRTRSLP